MNDEISILPFEIQNEPLTTDAGSNPFKLVVDPVMRMRLRKALFTLIEQHDTDLAQHVAQGYLTLDSYKEYIEVFSRSLRDTMGSKEGILYLLESCGFQNVPLHHINLSPEMRWN